jgi:hypothetical protein
MITVNNNKIITDTAIVYKRGNDCKEIHPEEYKIELNLDHEKIGIGMSGGMDSSILLWMLAKHITDNDLDITIYVWTCIHEEKPWQHIHAKKAIKFVKEEFPDVKFGQHKIRTTSALDYIDNGRLCSWALVEEENITALFNGVTVNPPNEIGESIWRKRWERRATNRDWDKRQFWIDERSEAYVMATTPPHTEYLPFVHSDKRIVLAFYKKYGLLASLGALTRSCEGWIEDTNYFTEECKGCWWCIEKEWATAEIFNYYPTHFLSTWKELDIR